MLFFIWWKLKKVCIFTKTKTNIMKISRLIIENDFIGNLENDFLFGYGDALKLLTDNTKKGAEWAWILEDYPKSKFSISIFNSNDNETKLYTISAKRITMLTKAGAY